MRARGFPLPQRAQLNQGGHIALARNRASRMQSDHAASILALFPEESASHVPPEQQPTSHGYKEPYGYKEPAPKPEPYGYPEPARNGYGDPASQPDPYGYPEPARNVYANPAPQPEWYGYAEPARDGYAEPAPQPELNAYGVPIQQLEPKRRPAVKQKPVRQAKSVRQGNSTRQGKSAPKARKVGPSEAVSVIALSCWTLLAAFLAYAYQPKEWLITAGATGFISLLAARHFPFVYGGATFALPPCIVAYIDTCSKTSNWLVIALIAFTLFLYVTVLLMRFLRLLDAKTGVP